MSQVRAVTYVSGPIVRSAPMRRRRIGRRRGSARLRQWFPSARVSACRLRFERLLKLNRIIVKPKLELGSPSSDHSLGAGEGPQCAVLLLMTRITLRFWHTCFSGSKHGKHAVASNTNTSSLCKAGTERTDYLNRVRS
jgi:hypothetical protein